MNLIYINDTVGFKLCLKCGNHYIIGYTRIYVTIKAIIRIKGDKII